MIFENIYLTDGTCVSKKHFFLKNVCYSLDTKNSMYWNIKKYKKKMTIINVFKNKFIKRK